MKGRELFRKKKVPQPSLIREDRMARTLAAEYDSLFKNLRVSASISPSATLQRLQELMGERGVDAERLRARLNAQLVGETRRALEELLESGPEELKMALLGKSFAIPAREAFGQRLSMIRELYLNDAVERIQGEEDLLKKSFLKKLTTWAENGGELDVQGLIQRMRDTADGRARFFARDQFSRFNRSVMVASYEQAEAPYIEWITSNDVRVRESHRDRNHRIYTPDQLKADPEWKAYNCRCGFAPLWTLTKSQENRRIA